MRIAEKSTSTKKCRLLKGDALAAFNAAATAAGNETNQNYLIATNGLVDHVFPRRALATQKCCMRQFMRKPATMTMHEYMARLTKINGKLDQFPPNAANQSLPQDNILDIGEFGMPNKWQHEMILHNFDPMEGTVQDLVAFCECLEQTEDHEANSKEVK